MENASKAIVMAAGVFIAVAVISVALYFYTAAKGFANTAEDVLSSTQIQSFNRFYTAYKTGDKPITVVDALNILNRAVEDGITHSNSSPLITLAGDYYTADSVNFLNENVLYIINYNVEGKVSGVQILKKT